MVEVDAIRPGAGWHMLAVQQACRGLVVIMLESTRTGLNHREVGDKSITDVRWPDSRTCKLSRLGEGQIKR